MTTNLTKIGIHQFHYQVDIGKLTNRLLGRKGIEQTYDLCKQENKIQFKWNIGLILVKNEKYIFVINQFHQFEFTVGSLSVSYILKWSTQFFDGNILSSNSIVGSTVK